MREEFPAITDDVLDSLPHRRDLSYEQKAIRFFLMLREENVGLGSTFRFFGSYGEEDAVTLPMRGKAMAWLGLVEAGQLSQMLLALEEEQLVRNQVGNLSLTPDGLRRLDKAMQSNESSEQAFVAMWFSAEMEEPYAHGFELGIAEKGYRALRIDKKEHANKIDDEIIAEIRRSRFVVADFTCELIKDGQQIKPAARGGVYYEAGFAQGLNIPVIWTVRSDCIEHVHFDTRQYAHIVWNDAEDLRAKLANRIGALFGDFGA